MALRGCMQCFKYSVFMLNFLIWLSGLFILGLAIYLRMDPTLNDMVAVGYTPHLGAYHFFCYFLVAFGAVVTFLGFLGCCSSYQESHTMLGFFLGVLIVFLMAEVGMCSWLVMQKKNAKHSVEDSMRDYIQKEYGTNLFTNEPVDQIQETFKCCGGSGSLDYLHSNWHNSTGQADVGRPGRHHDDHGNDRSHGNRGSTGQHQRMIVPPSCCGQGSKVRVKKQVVCFSDAVLATSVDRAERSKVQTNVAFGQGCAGQILERVEKYVERACIFTLVATSVQLLSLVLSLCLCCGLRRRSAGGYKS